MIKGLIALSFGTLSFGTAEFAVMGLLPYMAEAFSVTEAQAGNTIAAYSYGVCVGVIYLVAGNGINLKKSVLFITSVHCIAMICTALAGSYEALLAARFLSGLPHGCFIGSGAVIAAKLAGSSGKGSSAMAVLLAGQTLANVFGVPLGTALAHAVSWNMIFIILSIWSVVVLFFIYIWLPDPGSTEKQSLLSRLSCLKHRAPYFVGAAMLLGNGGIFCMHTYISPVLTDFVGIPLAAVSLILIIVGIGMAAANLIAGKISDIYTPGRVSCFLLITSVLSLGGSYLAGSNVFIAVPLLVYSSSMLFGLSTPLQVAVLRTAPKGELVAMAIGQIGFNLGNSLGAAVGGYPITAGMGVGYCILAGMFVTAAGAACMLFYILKDEHLYDMSRRQRMRLAVKQEALSRIQS